MLPDWAEPQNGKTAGVAGAPWSKEEKDLRSEVAVVGLPEQ